MALDRADLTVTGENILKGLTSGFVATVVLSPFLVGLAVTVPVLGHATWHLYRKVVL